MRKVFLIIFFFSFFVSFGQTSQTINSAALNNFNLLRENIFIHTDRDFYFAGDVLWFKVYVINHESHKLQSLSKTAFVEVVNKDNSPVLQAKILVDSGIGNGSFKINSSVESGRYTLRAYTNWMKNDTTSVFEKSLVILNTEKPLDTTVFKVNEEISSPQETRPLNVTRQGLSVTADKTNYRPRDLVRLGLNLERDSLANLSVSVYRLNEITRAFNSPDILDYVHNLRSQKPFETPLTYLPELNGMLVTAEVRKDVSGNGAAGTPVYLSALGKVTDVQAGFTDKEGKVNFVLTKEYGRGQILLKTDSVYQDGISFSVEKPFLSVYSNVSDKPVVFTKSEINDLEDMQSHRIVNRNFIPSYLDESVEATDSTPFYGKPYRTYFLDNYTRFTTMEEVLREYVQEVNVRIRERNYSLQVFNRQYFDIGKFMTLSNMMTDGNPLVLLDGVPVFNMNKIIAYDPLKVKKLDIVAGRYHIGPKSWNGLLSFSTYKGNFEGFQLNPHDMVVDFQGWQPKTEFHYPDYADVSLKNSRIPDFRELLYWNGNVTLHHYQGNLSFYTDDLAGKFIVVVQGITQSGVPVFGTTVFEVTR